MVKFLGMFAIMVSAVMMGLVMANELKERIKALKQVQQMAIHIKTDLEYRSPDICECFRSRGELFSTAHDLIINHAYTPEAAVKKAAGEISSFKKEEVSVIASYANNLKCEDIGGQIANVSWLIENIGKIIKTAEAEYESKSRLYRSGGVMVGFGFIILLL